MISLRFCKLTMTRPTVFLTAVLLSLCGKAAGTEGYDTLPRPVTGSYALEIGESRALSTYLSPLRYKGKVFAASGEWMKAFQKRPESWIMRFDASGQWLSMLNPAGTASMLGAQFHFGWGMSWRKELIEGLQIAAGPGISSNGGLLYLARNGNNPVAANASFGLTLNASLSYRMKIGKLPLVISDRASLPSLEGFFSPEYGETYYEIYLGNHKGLAHCGWWGNHFGIDNLLSVDLDFGRTAMRIGYHYSLTSSYVCDINSRLQTHTFVIGVIPGGLGLKQKKKAAYAY